jgi:hypothetical protein
LSKHVWARRHNHDLIERERHKLLEHTNKDKPFSISKQGIAAIYHLSIKIGDD